MMSLDFKCRLLLDSLVIKQESNEGYIDEKIKT